MMKMRHILMMVLAGIAQVVQAQTSGPNPLWRGLLHREDGKDIVFNFKIEGTPPKPLIYVRNGSEKIMVTDVTVTGDSVIARMPVFESEFRAKMIGGDSISGVWVKGTAGANQVMPFTATATRPYRFAAVKGNAAAAVSGKWSMTLTSETSTRPAIAVMTQQKNHLTGSILTPTGDYRFLEGIVTGDSLLLSTFDGVHAFLFTGTIKDGKTIRGTFYSSKSPSESWTAIRNDTATLPDVSAMYLKDPADSRLHFTFPDLNGKKISISDPQFKNKVVVIQLMGSWCPNCMDETAFLSDWYRKNHSRGVEAIALAYEYTTDFQRSQKSLRKFQQKFAVAYSMLITPVSVSDSLRTEKTLPQFTDIKSFPTSIVVDKKGRVRKVMTDFYGPGTGAYYEAFQKEFEQTIDDLLKE